MVADCDLLTMVEVYDGHLSRINLRFGQETEAGLRGGGGDSQLT